jgi:hypothetical protein
LANGLEPRGQIRNEDHRPGGTQISNLERQFDGVPFHRVRFLNSRAHGWFGLQSASYGGNDEDWRERDRDQDWLESPERQ